jgi:DNA-binding transcriptional MocR family regulator
MLWVEFPAKVNASLIWQETPKYGVIAIPGNYCCLRNQFPRHFAFTFGKPYSEKLEKAYKIVGDLAKKQLVRQT